MHRTYSTKYGIHWLTTKYNIVRVQLLALITVASHSSFRPSSPTPVMARQQVRRAITDGGGNVLYAQHQREDDLFGANLIGERTDSIELGEEGWVWFREGGVRQSDDQIQSSAPVTSVAIRDTRCREGNEGHHGLSAASDVDALAANLGDIYSYSRRYVRSWNDGRSCTFSVSKYDITPVFCCRSAV